MRIQFPRSAAVGGLGWSHGLLDAIEFSLQFVECGFVLRDGIGCLCHRLFRRLNAGSIVDLGILVLFLRGGVVVEAAFQFGEFFLLGEHTDIELRGLEEGGQFLQDLDFITGKFHSGLSRDQNAFVLGKCGLGSFDAVRACFDQSWQLGRLGLLGGDSLSGGFDLGGGIGNQFVQISHRGRCGTKRCFCLRDGGGELISLGLDRGDFLWFGFRSGEFGDFSGSRVEFFLQCGQLGGFVDMSFEGRRPCRFISGGFGQGGFGFCQGLFIRSDLCRITLGAPFVLSDLGTGFGETFLTGFHIGLSFLDSILKRWHFGHEFGGTLLRLDDALGDERRVAGKAAPVGHLGFQ